MGLPLETERLVIRPFRPEDAEQIHGAYVDPEVGIPLAHGRTSRSMEETQGVLEQILQLYEAQDGLGPWAIVERSEEMVIGDCGLYPSTGGSAGELEMAYRLRRSSWGRGYATEAADAVLRHGFSELGVSRVVADVEADNEASCRVLEKLGMVVEWTDVREGRTILVYATDRPPPEAPPGGSEQE